MIRTVATFVAQVPAVILILTGLPWAAAAQMDQGSSFAPAGGTAVEITVVGTPLDLQRIRSVIEPRPLGGAQPRWTREANFNPLDILRTVRDPRTLVHCWVDVGDPTHVKLYFAARSGQQFLVRDVEMSGRFEEVDRESLSNVLELSITALLENEQAGLNREQAQAVLVERQENAPPRVADEPHALPQPSLPPSSNGVLERPPPGPRTPLRVNGRVFYASMVPGGGLPILHGPGLSVGLGGDDQRATVGPWISGQLQWPARYASPEVGVQVQTIAARGGLEFRLPIGAYQLAASLGGGLDLVRVSPQPGTLDSNATLTPTRWSQALVFGAAVGIRKAVGTRFLVGIAALADLVPTAVHYDVNVGGQTRPVISPRRLRPGVVVEFCVR